MYTKKGFFLIGKFDIEFQWDQELADEIASYAN